MRVREDGRESSLEENAERPARVPTKNPYVSGGARVYLRVLYRRVLSKPGDEYRDGIDAFRNVMCLRKLANQDEFDGQLDIAKRINIEEDSGGWRREHGTVFSQETDMMRVAERETPNAPIYSRLYAHSHM
ncbi:hypothetical protein KQX54_017090 [Cotesia glomerata]|uniref:Uncharacterized protein n=1 Tax=Cotesia glomerata TaxID=32391 RepID=A0AAV7HVZ8_COTGL|nr:hypothetical protein KQX54_017090 [Cotesia glomerata]